MDALDLKNFCMTDDEVALERFAEPSTLSTLVRPVALWTDVLKDTSLLFLPWCDTVPFRLVPEGFRLEESNWVLGFDEMLGLEVLDAMELLVEAEIGRRGGGIASCLVLMFSGCFSAFELLRFHDKLSLRLKELIEEGVWGSSGLGSCTGDLGLVLIGALITLSLDIVFDGCLCARGPDGFGCVAVVLAASSVSRISLPVCDLLK